MNKMKKIYWMLLVVLCAACSDPYEGETYVVDETQPATTYMEGRAEELSEWIHAMKYTNLFNAVADATRYFTLFVPNNAAMQEFYTRKGVTSFEELAEKLGDEYVKDLVSYHIIQDTINQTKFTEKEGRLAQKTVSDDFLTVSFGSAENGGGGMQSVYLNNEARVVEFANQVSNGFVYVLEDALTPLTESVYERISENGRPYTLLKSALDATGWGTELNTIYDEIENEKGQKIKQKRNYTLLAVSDDVFRSAGVNGLDDLANLLGADRNYTNPENALYKYIAYHILNGSYEQKDLQSFDTEDATSKVWSTLSKGDVVRISREEDGKFYLNYHDEPNKAVFLEDNCNVQAKNGYIHQISTYLPIAEVKPETVLFDVCNYPVIKDWIEAGHGEAGIQYQTLGDAEKKCDLTEIPRELSCYEYKLSNPGGDRSKYPYVTYFQVKSGNDWKMANNYDFLMLNIGNTGWISMETPSIIKGKYKVTMRFGFANSMDFIRTKSSNSNGAQMILSFDGKNSVTVSPYSSPTSTLTSKTLGCYTDVVYDEIEFTESSTHTFRLVLTDPAASSNSDYRINIDYLLFEPILDE